MRKPVPFLTIESLATLLCVLFLSSGPHFAGATDLDTIGVTALRALDGSLTGSGVGVAQPEAGGSAWQVNPAVVGQPHNLFTWQSLQGNTTEFPNLNGTESPHANAVAGNFYGTSVGVAPGVSHIDNYEAGFFHNAIVLNRLPIDANVVNISFVDGALPPRATDSAYDNYIVTYNTVIVGGVGNGGAVLPPSTSYNGIAAAAFGGVSSFGPTPDNGRSKPDITAPAGFTSFSTPLVAGAAAVLIQAGARNDAGAGSAAAATNSTVVKALLLNGAEKPGGWTNGVTRPLDARYGAGILNLYHSYLQLLAGKHPFIESTSASSGSAHPPGQNTGNVPSPRGWDHNTVTSSLFNDGVNHYYFHVPATAGNSFSVIVTLVWNRGLNQTGINNLDLFLYDTSEGSQAASSVSPVDNVEHLFLVGLKPGRYDLQVLKHAGLPSTGTSQAYALAFDLVPETLSITCITGPIIVSWPASAAGFSLESTATADGLGGWTQIQNGRVLTNSQYLLSQNPDALQFFRLRRY